MRSPFRFAPSDLSSKPRPPFSSKTRRSQLAVVNSPKASPSLQKRLGPGVVISQLICPLQRIPLLLRGAVSIPVFSPSLPEGNTPSKYATRMMEFGFANSRFLSRQHQPLGSPFSPWRFRPHANTSLRLKTKKRTSVCKRLKEKESRCGEAPVSYTHLTLPTILLV